MTRSDTALVALAVASALHLGFQLTVTMVVYPALARVDDARWQVAHARHSRAVIPLVALTYGALVLSAGWALVAARGERGEAWVIVSAVGALVAVLTTATAAAPLHGRLSGGRDEALVVRLLRADRVRALGAVISFVGAALAVGTALG